MHRFKSHITQFPGNMQALIIFHINNSFTDITTKHKTIAICKKFAKLRHTFLFYIYGKEKSTIKIIQNQSLRAIQKKVFSKPWKILEEYLCRIPILALEIFQFQMPQGKVHINLQQSSGQFVIFLLSSYNIHFFVPSTQASCLGCDYCVLNRLNALETNLLPKQKIERIQSDLDYFIISVI